jgi:hypothetical protein
MTAPSQPPPARPLDGATRLGACALLRQAEAGRAEAGPHLLVREPGTAPRVVPLTADCTVGRGAAAALRLSDPSASRLHLRLRVDAAGTSAEDLGSRNGLCVNGGRARGLRRLRSGDELEAGETLLRFVDPLEPGWPGAGLPGAGGRGAGGVRCRERPAGWPLAAAAALLLAAALTLLLA